jgi:parvulin-like peptidyl-prolyl isomerase
MQIKAKHILVEQEFEAKDLLKKIQSGEKFEDLAKVFSQCPSKEEGGDLGAFSKDQMVESFSNAAFALKVGEISEPVRTRFGFHLIMRYE